MQPNITELLTHINLLERLKEVLFLFPIYLLISMVITLIFISVGDLTIKPIFKEKSVYLRFSVAGLCGMMITVVIMNFLSYEIKPPASLNITWLLMILMSIARIAFSKYHSLLSFLKNQSCPGHSIHRIVNQVICELKNDKYLIFVLLFLFGLLFLSTVNIHNFDENFHTPVIATILKGSFPIRCPTNPFWIRQYDYHYGWQLLAASIASFWKSDIPMGLDILKLSGLILGVVFIWGILQKIKIEKRVAAWSLLAVIITGPFWFFQDAYTKQYIFNISQPGANFSILHCLQAISTISVFVWGGVSFLLVKLITEKKPNLYFYLFLLIILPLIFAGVAITGEYHLAMIFLSGSATIFFLLFKAITSKKLRVILLRNSLLLGLAVALSLLISIYQGGVLTGIISQKKIMTFGLEKYSALQTIASNIRSESKKTVAAQKNVKTEQKQFISAPVTKPSTTNTTKPIFALKNIKDFGPAYWDSVYIKIFDKNNFLKLLSIYGVFGIFILPIFLVKAFLYIGRHTKNVFLIYLCFTVLIFSVLPIIAATRYGDQGLMRGMLIVMGIVYGWVTIYWSTKKKYCNKILNITYKIFLISSWLPTLIFIGGVFLVKPSFGPFSSRSSLLKNLEKVKDNSVRDGLTAEKTIFNKINDLKIAGDVVTLNDDGLYFTEQTGLTTYGGFFSLNPTIYNLISKDLVPEEVKFLEAEYIYMTPDFYKNLSAFGKNNLNNGYLLLIEAGSGDSKRALYAVK